MDDTLPPPPAPLPDPDGARPDPDGARPAPLRTRRWFLAGGLAVVAGAGAGVGAEFLRHRSPAALPAPPAALVAAAAAERALIADLAATTGGAADVRVVIEHARANHAAHLSALQALLSHYRRPAKAAVAKPGTPRSKAQLRAAEAAAATGAERRAGTLTGTPAALLASIAACEATHAELLA